MNINIEELNIDLDRLRESVELGCSWLIDIAQVKTDRLTIENDTFNHQHKRWRGAIRGEYRVAEGKWDFFCPIWHTGQAVKALTMAYKVLGEKRLLEAANLGAEFILNERVTDPDDPDYGLIFAFESIGNGVNTSAILECLDGLIHLSEVTGKEKLWEAVIDALNWVADKTYIEGEGLFRDLYIPEERKFKFPHWKPKMQTPGRPLLDDGVFYKGYRKTGEKRFLRIFLEVADRLLRDEEPPGNWIRYPPCNYETGSIHPRHAYWWGYPMIMAYEETGERKYLECAVRAADWYVKAQRRDGGLFRATFSDFNTLSFGHATSGIACATILWWDLTRILDDKRYLEPIRKAMNFCMMMQIRNPQDPNLRGVILEKVLPPDGTDRSPYHIRDLGTIFFIQAASKILMDLE